MQDNMPKLKLEDYQASYARAEQFAKKNNKLVLFGRFGSIKNPPISDLDVLACFKDDFFTLSREEFLNFIKDDEILSYLFIHDPLIISESMLKCLPYVHTLYDLDLTYNPDHIRIESPGEDCQGLLENIWTSFLIPVSLGVFLSPRDYTSRYKLLLIGNICRSLININEDSNALFEAQELRNSFLKGEVSENDIEMFLYGAVQKLFKKLDLLNLNVGGRICKKAYKINLKTLVIFSGNNCNSFQIIDGKIKILLNRELFTFFEKFYYTTVESNLHDISIYKESAKKLYKICLILGVSYPFIAPFSYPFFRSDLKFLMKKVLFRLFT